MDISGTTIGRSMVGIVARIPLYSATEMDRERQREYQRRSDTAAKVAEFVGQLAAAESQLITAEAGAMNARLSLVAMCRDEETDAVNAYLSELAQLLPGAAGDVVAAFAWGGLSHVMADALTVSGVPFSPRSERRFHLFGGRLRTGGGGYMPFFPDWSARYEAGTATAKAKAWRENRFRFF